LAYCYVYFTVHASAGSTSHTQFLELPAVAILHFAELFALHKNSCLLVFGGGEVHPHLCNSLYKQFSTHDRSEQVPNSSGIPGEFGCHWIPILGEHFTVYCITKSSQHIRMPVLVKHLCG